MMGVRSIMQYKLSRCATTGVNDTQPRLPTQ
jgi:hypothetical protein